MSLSVITSHHFPVRKAPQLCRRPNSNTRLLRCSSSRTERAAKHDNYYELLGVSVDANPLQIKQAYRKLQKKFHPDIAGPKGHEYTLILNEAYNVLMREDLRRDYDASIGQRRACFTRRTVGLGYSSWKGPLRPQALFVDENACIGCRECVNHANNTYEMDETVGCARVKVQYGDDDKKIEVSVDSCPVNCIHWVDREELAVLEFLMQPQPVEAYGVFGGGWKRPVNVFTAAKSFSKQLEQEATTEYHQRNGRNVLTLACLTVEEETPAQAKARANASIKIKMDGFSRIWNLFKVFGSNRWNWK